MGMNGVNNLKYISFSNVRRKLNKNNANDDKRGEDDFDTLNSKLRQNKAIEFKNVEHIFENEPNSKPLPRITPIFNGQNTSVLSDPKVDSWKRAMLFMDHKQ